MKLAAGCAPEPAQQVGLHPDLFCSANDLPALGVSDFESPFAYGTDDGFFTPNEKYSIHCCRMFHNMILLSLILGTTLRNINLAGESSYCGGFFISPQYQLVGFILTGILADYLRQNKRSKVLAPGQCQGAAWRQVGLAETPNYAITWDKYNYMKAVFIIRENGMNGIGKFERVQYFKTIRSRVYHFIR